MWIIQNSFIILLPRGVFLQNIGRLIGSPCYRSQQRAIFMQIPGDYLQKNLIDLVLLLRFIFYCNTSKRVFLVYLPTLIIFCFWRNENWKIFYFDFIAKCYFLKRFYFSRGFEQADVKAVNEINTIWECSIAALISCAWGCKGDDFQEYTEILPSDKGGGVLCVTKYGTLQT